MTLTDSERSLLEWIAEGEVAQYGECHGATLDALFAKGFAELMGEDSGLNNPFIAKGRGLMYRAVRVTDAGRQALAE